MTSGVIKTEYLEKEALRIIDLLKTDFVFKDGSFFLEKKGDKIFPYHIYPDLGDFLMFFLYFKEESFVKKQIALFKKQLEDYLYISEFKTFGLPNLAKSYEYTDMLVGLTDYYSTFPNEDNKKLLLGTFEKAVQIFNLNKQPNSFFYVPLNKRIPIFDTRDGTFIEICVDLSNTLSDPKYLKIAQNIYKGLISSDFYKKTGILPKFDGPTLVKKIISLKNKEKFLSADITKNNTNTLFGLLALYRANGDRDILESIDRVVRAIADKSSFQGGVSNRFIPGVIPKQSDLLPSFSVIDFLCDLYKETSGSYYLNLAREITDFWINLQGKTGLFPINSQSTESFFDSETDMVVALMKLYELTQNTAYKNSAHKCFTGIIKYHGGRDYVLSVNVDDGRVVNKTQRTKFLALFLKAIILMIEINKGNQIYKDQKLFDLLRDR